VYWTINDFDADACRSLAAALTVNRTLKNIRIDRQPGSVANIGEQAALALAEALETNTCLVRCEVDYATGVSIATQARIEIALELRTIAGAETPTLVFREYRFLFDPARLAQSLRVSIQLQRVWVEWTE
jgi:hypothetical protein